MNVFVLDDDPVCAAQYHCDKHVVKMCLEYAQIICTVAHQYGVNAPYKPTHKNHPCVKWAAESSGNILWLYSLLEELDREYRFRFDKEDRHASLTAVRTINPVELCNTMPLAGCFDSGVATKTGHPMTPFVECMPADLRTGDPIESYRKYYLVEKARFATWRKRGAPPWWTGPKE